MAVRKLPKLGNQTRDQKASSEPRIDARWLWACRFSPVLSGLTTLGVAIVDCLRPPLASDLLSGVAIATLVPVLPACVISVLWLRKNPPRKDGLALVLGMSAGAMLFISLLWADREFGELGAGVGLLSITVQIGVAVICVRTYLLLKADKHNLVTLVARTVLGSLVVFPFFLPAL
jgi:hypothetical protein